MIKNHLPGLLPGVLALLLVACSSGDDNSSGDSTMSEDGDTATGGMANPDNDSDDGSASGGSTPPAEDTDGTAGGSETTGNDGTLQGAWRAACDTSPSNIANSDRETIRIDGNTYELITEFYADNGCNNAVVSTIIQGSFVEAGAIAPTDTGTGANINISTTAAVLTPLTGLAATGLNVDATCNATNWAQGETQNVDNCVEIENSAVPALSFDLYLIESSANGDVLYLGVGRSNNIEDRPVEPDFTNPYQRVE